MKKAISIAASLVLCLMIFAGCGAKEANLNEVMDKINSEYQLSLQTFSSVDDLNKYYSINTSDVKQFAAEIDSNNDRPIVIIMVEAVDSEAAGNVEKALTNYYNSIISTYSSYSAENLEMVKSCKVTKDGNFVSLIVASDAQGMLDIYYSFIK